MGLEQRIDLLSPLQGLMAKVGEAMKSSLPTDAKVKVELETTPLQDVEASIARVTDSHTESAAAKLGAAEDPFAKVSTAQEEIDKVFKSMEAKATRIAYLLSKIEGGKDATGNAAQEVERLRDSLEKVAQKGREAAKSLGNEGLASKISEAEKAAAVGQGGKAAEGGGVSVGNLMSMIRNPQGAMMQGGEMALGQLMGEGGALSGAMKVLGPAAAVVGGIWAGIKINDTLAKEATSDARKAVEDASLSNMVSGGKFDFRGELFDADRFGPKLQTRDMQDLSNVEVRRVLRGMGVGVDNWTSNDPTRTHGQTITESAMLQARYAYGMGVSTDQMAGMVGAGIRTGALAPNDMAIHRYLSQIAGATEEAAKQGVSASEKLSVIASMNQRSVAATGYLSADQSKLNMRASAALEATGDAALKGQLGQSALETMGGSGSDEARAREIGFMMDSNGNLKPEYKKFVLSNPHLKRIYEEMGPAMAADALLDDPTMRAGVNQRAVRSIVGAGGSSLLAARLMGVNANTSKSAVALSGFMDGNDILTQTLSDKMTPIDTSKAGGKELTEALGAQWSGDQRADVRQTGYTYEAAKNLNEAATKLNSVADHLGRALSDGALANSTLGANPMTAAPYWMIRGFQ